MDVYVTDLDVDPNIDFGMSPQSSAVAVSTIAIVLSPPGPLLPFVLRRSPGTTDCHTELRSLPRTILLSPSGPSSK